MTHGVAHFEIHVDDVERAKAFYGTLFGWSFEQFPGGVEYWLINIGSEEQGGGLLKRNAPKAAPGSSPNSFVCTVNVDSIDATAQLAQQHGAILAMDKVAIPGMGWNAYLIDPEGNLFGLFQMDPNATM